MKMYLNGAGFVILFVTVIIVSGLLGQEDYRIEVAEHNNYISMVCSTYVSIAFIRYF